MIMIKEGVRIKWISEEIEFVLRVLPNIYWTCGIKVDPWITSWFDGNHMKGSLHPKGLAIDLRIRQFTMATRQELVCELRKGLGPSYDVVLEVDHVHIEYDPDLKQNKKEPETMEV